MKKILLLLVVVLISILWISGQSDWHIDRNKQNKLPAGVLKSLNGNLYEDEVGLVWELQPQIKNKFHQPDQESEIVENPYPNVDGHLSFDTKNPNIKFLSRTDDGGSYEAILQPNGEYLTKGLKQGTYNYGHPNGFWGTTKHVFFDVLPHFVNAEYIEN
jgi:hypothetical protein